MPRRSRVLAALIAAATAGSLLVAPAASAAPEPQPPEDYCRGQCDHILPPGQNGNATFAELVSHMLLGTRPPHSDDQLGEYDALAHGYSQLTTGTIREFFDDNSFGVPEDQVERRYSPRADVTIVRDNTAGIPHVYGSTRAGTTFGAGYATAEDKLFLMDAMRRAGRGEVTPFAGGAQANRELEQRFFAAAPYTEQELQQQIDAVAESGERGRTALQDAESYVEGINDYIEKAHEGRYFPGEYVATGHVDPVTNVGEIQPFKLTDLVVLASLVGAQFGGGGGGEVQNAIARMALHERFGAARGERIWQAFRAENDPEAISTVHDGRSFPYANAPADPKGAAMPDPGSVEPQQLVFDRSGSAATSPETPDRPETTNPEPAGAGAEALRGMFDDGLFPEGMGESRGMSNALVVSGDNTESGHPVAVFGPQTGYFSPQLLTLQELQGPGISSKGASFAGLSFYTLLGRGQDYAWSATTAAQDIIDTYAVRLCDPEGGPVAEDSNHYLFRGECLPMRTVERENSWTPNLGDDTPPGSYRLVSFRTRYGPVTHRGTVDGEPVAFTTARSTFLHEVDSIIGFQKFNDPGAIRSASDFQRVAHEINYTFNWFYADAEDTAYFNSGANVVRQPHVDPSMPIASAPANDWRGWNPADNTADLAPFSAHPNSIDQDYYISWNNKQAPGTAGASAEKNAVQRGDLLDRRVREQIEAGDPFSRVELVRAMADAGLTDLRAERVLPDLLRLIDTAPVDDPGAKQLLDQLRAWLADGGRRVENEPGSRRYAHAEAIELFDAWWPLLVRGEFEPALGAEAYRALTRVMQINESPSGWQNGEPGLHVGQGHQGSAFQYGWYGQVSKDVRAALGERVPGGFGESLCGNGDPNACRAVLLDALRQAAEVPSEETYPGDADCDPGDQWCADAIVHSKIGGIAQDPISWQNRPTYQQVVEFPAHR
ncbi:penicillin acylase family protein [Saccharopolyspora griseoalba]|uniref:Penicillin acylase family protein n=1 Tax=Saccharopolyspora griseoalba TaxID=1431848 RepID=A0ABW2LL67_9PSEU